jgi:hypothetical protein
VVALRGARGALRTDDGRLRSRASELRRGRAGGGGEAVCVGPPGGTPNSTPCVAERIVVRPASTNATTDVLAALRRMQDAALRVRDVTVDRGYSYKTNWTPGVIALGLDPVHDLHAKQYGARGTHADARIVTGVPHCPAMPTGIDDIRRPERLAAGPELDRFTDVIAEQRAPGAAADQPPDRTGKETLRMPRPRREDQMLAPQAVAEARRRPPYRHQHARRREKPRVLQPADHHHPRHRRTQSAADLLLGQSSSRPRP